MPEKKPWQKDHLPPHNDDAEEALIGSVLVGPDCFPEIRQIVSTEDFFTEVNRTVWNAFLKVEHIDQVTVAIEVLNEMRQGKSLIEFNAPVWLAHCVATVPTSLHAKYYADIIKKLSLIRQVIDMCGKLALKAYESGPDIEDLLNKAQEMLDIIKHKTMVTKEINVSAIIILTSNPRSYKLIINDKEISMDAETLGDYINFKKKIMTELDFIPNLPFGKQGKEWEKFINELLSRAEKQEVPIEANEDYNMRQDIYEWLEEIPIAQEYTDLKGGAYKIDEVKGKEYYFFQSRALQKALKSKKVNLKQNLWSIVERWGAIKHELKVGKMAAKLWGLPIGFEEKPEPIKEEDVSKEKIAEAPGAEEIIDTETLPDWF